MISIIIPCYNSGHFLMEAIESCLNSTFIDFEIIIVNDGSTDSNTLTLLRNLNYRNLKVIHKKNGGPASARNLGVSHAVGDFLLFLDSDNSIMANYIAIAMKVFESDKEIGVIYSKPNFFGDLVVSEERFEVKPYNLDAILAGNYIDMCSFIRKEAFLEVGGFDEHRDMIGWEDGELWIRLGQTKWKFFFINEKMFNYRIRKDSLMGAVSIEKKEKMLRYFGSKHGYIIHQKYRRYFRVLDKFQKQPFAYFLRILYYKYIKRKPFLQ